MNSDINNHRQKNTTYLETAQQQKTAQWERLIVLELNREHEAIYYNHKIKLKPISIVLFDSENRWGEYNSQSRTISISRKLIFSHPWSHVIGVFLHEVAHQYVDEYFPNATSGPHGIEFQRACQKLGIPKQFSYAGLDLQNCEIDWKLSSTNIELEKVLDKTKKLLALGNSANEHEAHLAMEKVRQLYAKYNLDHNLSYQKENDFVHLVINYNKKKLASWEKRIITILSEHFFVKIILISYFNVNRSERFPAVEIIGTKENVLMAEYVFYFLKQQTESLLNDALSFKKINTSLVAKNSFRLGVLEGFDKKLLESQYQIKMPCDPTQKNIPNRNELTLVGEALSQFKNNNNLSEYIDQIFPRLRSGTKSKYTQNSQAFAAGQSAGKDITLKKPLTSPSTNKGFFLGYNK